MQSWTPFNKFTDEELIREFRVSDDPIVQEFVIRLGEALDDPEAEIAELKDEIAGWESQPCEGCAELKAEQEEHEDKHAVQIDELEEQLAHERSRIAEFHAENQNFIAEIKRLKPSQKAIQTEKEPPMLEQQIEKLTTRVAAVETKQDRTNELLAAILEAVSDRPLPPVETAKPVTLAASNDDQADTDTVDKEPEAPADKPVTMDDMRDALLGVQEKHGREAAVRIVTQFSDGGPKIGDVPTDKYPDMLAACVALDQKAAA